MSKFLKVTGAAVVGLVLVVALQTPAFASWGGCASSPPRVCTYWDSGGNGAVYYYTGPSTNACIDIGEPWDNDISSVWNRFTSGEVVRLYPWENCKGVARVVDPNKQVPDMGWWNDTASSMRIGPL